ncbi:MAG: S41 family peptidase [Gemmatimonadetes bacterium]|nr:S41 family peptidase [Gemmatimonadota bacterium]
MAFASLRLTRSAFAPRDLVGKPVSLRQFRGKVVLLDFWASRCGPRISDLPFLRKLKKEIAGQAVVFLNLSLDSSESAWRKAIEEHEIEGVHVRSDVSIRLRTANWLSFRCRRRLFFATLERVHPFPLRHIAGQDYLDLKKSVRCRLQRLEASRGHISHPDLSGILAEAAACLKDGHTEIMPVVPIIEAANPDVLMFPFRLKRRFDDLAVEDTIPGFEDLTGKSLVSVDDRPIKEFLQPALCRISGESDTHRLVQFLDNQRLYGAWCSLFTESPVTMRFVEKRKTSTRRIDLTSLREYDELLPEGEESEGFHHFYRDDNTCYFNCESFVDTDVRRTYMAELFSELRAKKSQRLIIDIRQNGGGNPDLVVFLLEFLTEKPFKMWSRVDIKISDLLIEQHSDYSPYSDLAGLILSESDDPVKPQRREDLFKGDLYVLIGPCTFSAAAEFAAVVKDHGLGQLVGEETGGRRQSTGDALTGLLPLSGIRFRVSAMLYYAATPEAGDETRGTRPDISPKAEELSEFEETADPLLQYTLEHIV